MCGSMLCVCVHTCACVCVYLGDVVASLLADGVEPGQTEEGLGAGQQSSFTDLLWAPGLIGPQQVLLQTWGGLGGEIQIGRAHV